MKVAGVVLLPNFIWYTCNVFVAHLWHLLTKCIKSKHRQTQYSSVFMAIITKKIAPYLWHTCGILGRIWDVQIKNTPTVHTKNRHTFTSRTEKF